jgi:hypothetical protein
VLYQSHWLVINPRLLGLSPSAGFDRPKSVSIIMTLARPVFPPWTAPDAFREALGRVECAGGPRSSPSPQSQPEAASGSVLAISDLPDDSILIAAGSSGGASIDHALDDLSSTIARIVDPNAMALAHKLGRPDAVLNAEMQERIRVAREKAYVILAALSSGVPHDGTLN